MNAATDFDLGPLTWVKGEIDLALERATEALQQFREHGDATQLKFCRTHLHQVHLEMLPQDPDPVEKLILQDARQWLSALAQQRPIRPALIGAGQGRLQPAL